MNLRRASAVAFAHHRLEALGQDSAAADLLAPPQVSLKSQDGRSRRPCCSTETSVKRAASREEGPTGGKQSQSPTLGPGHRPHLPPRRIRGLGVHLIGVHMDSRTSSASIVLRPSSRILSPAGPSPSPPPLAYLRTTFPELDGWQPFGKNKSKDP